MFQIIVINRIKWDFTRCIMVKRCDGSQPEASTSDYSTSSNESQTGACGVRATSSPDDASTTTIVWLPDGGFIVRKSKPKVNANRNVETPTKNECQLPVVQLSSRVVITQGPRAWRRVLTEATQKKLRYENSVNRQVGSPAQTRVQRSRRVKTSSSSVGADDSNFRVEEAEQNVELTDSSSNDGPSSVVAKNMVPIGNGNALVSSQLLNNLNWGSYKTATRKLLAAVFSRRVLATHSLTGKRSPAFPNKPAKKKLNAALINDIVSTVVERCKTCESLVRTCITTKCADESKMLRNRIQKKKRLKKENIRPRTSTSVDSETPEE
ncbi:protein insensitive-like isoform X6 [Pectinophora gossypiella]|uniref:protein insensitive-like isoform X6 n=1 Tax=Pectinophora gossypiella TaxID=13191 RepID=UPI00214E03EC|nr:protein insensitive-like isoform X6 [Pectinophora gossypiella]